MLRGETPKTVDPGKVARTSGALYGLIGRYVGAWTKPILHSGSGEIARETRSTSGLSFRPARSEHTRMFIGPHMY
jgi:hypothetical protein